MKNHAPLFDRSAEDGTRFRVFQVGALEVRTTQELGGREAIGAIFSRQAVLAQGPASCTGPSALSREAIVKVTEYVEAPAPGGGDGRRSGAKLKLSGGKKTRAEGAPHHYFVVLETETGAAIVTEKLERDWGRVTWEENPDGLYARAGLAKVVGCVDCLGTGLCAQDMKALQVSETHQTGLFVSRYECRRYARGLYRQALRAQRQCWEALTDDQKRAAEQLGIHKWSEGAAGAGQLAWADMTEQQRGAALDLGVDEVSWDGALSERCSGEARPGATQPPPNMGA